MIKAIIFDCFGVLTTDTWRAFIDSLPESADTNAARETHRAYDAGLLDKETAAEQIKQATGSTFTELEDIRVENTIKNEQLLIYIKQLKPRYKIGLLSNVATPWITDSFLTPDEQELFDAMVFSYETGMTKPDPQIFELVCKKLNVEPQEAVMIDDIERYCEAARDIGMQAVVYRDLKQLKQELKRILADLDHK
ncbi:MAG: HAD family phosphatase [Candidatus Saccharibacteria bacterium]|nr:HAD family phosphatase [Candidatus Saccharibacteria bacterium]